MRTLLRLAAAALLATLPAAGRAQFPITESFMNATAPGWTLLGNATLTAASGVDPAGQGWLRLTRNIADQAGSAIYNTAFSSSRGILVTFDYADYGGTGADGFSFYLINGATGTPTVGSPGGSLGYAAKYSNTTCATGPLTATIAGVTNGYVGIGFDEFGNFSACESGYAAPGLTTHSVVIRGSGSLSAGTAFRYLTGRQISTLFGRNIDGVPRTGARQVRISIVNQIIRVDMDFGSGFQTVVPNYDLSAAPNQAALPATFKMGFSGSTGGSNNTHEIRNISVTQPLNLTVTQSVNPTTVAVGGTLTYTIVVANDNSNIADPVTISDLFPAGLTGVSWSVAGLTGGATVSSASGSGNLADTLHLPRNSSVTFTVTATVLPSAAGTTLSNTVTVTPPAGSTNLLSNTSATVLGVTPMASATALASSANPSAFGQATTLTATVTSPVSGTPTGTVTFLDGSTVLGTAPLSAGVATLSVSSLAVGSHPALHASYGGATAYTASASADLLQTVQPAATATTVVASPAPSIAGQAVTLAALVSAVPPGAGTPAGTVTFRDGAAVLGTVPLDGSGAASLTTATLPAGTHLLTASYDGSGNFDPSASSTWTQLVSRAATSTGLGSAPNPSRFGEPVVLTATVSPGGFGLGSPTGSVTFFDGAAPLGTVALDAGGLATLSLASLPVGTHALSAGYLGDAGYAPSGSAPVSQVVSAAQSSTALASSANPSALGQAVTLTATVAAVVPGAGTPTGTVTFHDGAVSLGTASLLGGVATLGTAALSPGGHTLTAVYAGSPDFQGSTSPALAQVVNPGATAVALLASPSPAISGEPVQLTAQVTAVAPAGGIPGGTVTFLDNGVVIGTAPLDATGRAVLPAAFLTGTHLLTVTYGGASGWLPGASGDVPLPVGQGAADATLASSLSPSTYGDAVTLTATVAAQAPAAGTPSGTVTFYDGAVAIGSATLAGGQATLAVAALAAGSHDLTVRYAGDAEFLASSSPVVTQLVTQATPGVALTSSAPAPAFGDPLTLTATVSGPLGAATGTVTFRDGATVLCLDVPLVGGIASCGPLTPGAGSHAYAAAYPGDPNHAAGSGALTLPVAPAPTATALAVTPSPSLTGQLVTLQATVAATNGAPGTPTGTVTFRDGATVLATVPLDGSGQASLPLGTLGVGPHLLTATFDGSPDFAGTASPATGHQVDPAPTALVLAAAPSPATYGAAVTLTATVTVPPPGAGAPGGAVSFRDGTTLLGSAPVGPGGIATLPAGTLPVGSHALTASYSGDASFLGSGGSASLSVAPASADVALGSSLNPSTFGDGLLLDATVSGPLGQPTGTVTFSEGATVLCAAVPLSGGTASCPVTGLSAGPHTLGAAYSGDANHAVATSPGLVQVVLRAGTSTALVSAVNPTLFGQPTTLTATVASAAGTPSGTVTFLDGATTLGTATLNGAGVATLPVAGLAVGTHLLTARHEGDADHAPSTSAPVAQVVGKASTTTALAVAPSPAVAGQAVVLTATVAALAPGAGTPSGSVTFLYGAAVLGIGTLDASGQATFTTSTLPPGTHALTAVYPGDAAFNGSTTTAAVSLTVTQSAVVVTLSPVPNPSVFGEPVTLSVVVAAAVGTATPTGTVIVRDGAATLATLALSAGAASTSVATLAVGNHALTASYGGDGLFLAGSGPATQEVGRAATATALSSSVNPSRLGQAVTFTATVSVAAPGAGTPTGTVTFTDGASVLCGGPVALTGASAACALAGLPVGGRPIGAAYSGDTSFAGSAGALTQTVGKSATSLALAAAPSPSMYGQAVLLTAQVAAVAPGGGIPTGTVTFSDGLAAIGSAPLDGSGRAALSTSTLPSGARALSAAYGGDAGFLPSSGTAAHTVQPGSATVSVVSSRNPSRRGRPVTFTATVTSPHATPAGSVDFKEGSAVLGTATLGSDGKAAFTTRDLRKGTHPITAAYTPSADFVAASGDLSGGQVVENTPPVAGAGTALALAPTAATSARVDASGGALDLATLTVELWARAGWSAPGDVSGTPGLLRLGPAAGPRLALGVTPDRRGLVVTGRATATVPAALDDGAWHHLALVADTSGIAVWMDGAPIGHLSDGLDPAARGGDLTLGAGFLGEIDELRAWSTARSGAELAATSRKPLRGDEAGLAGTWRMDEGEGLELFDAGPHHLDGAVTLAAGASGAAPAFTASGAWRHREVWQERDLSPAVEAGYDADGDPLTLTLVSPAAHGNTSLDPAALRLGYHPANGWLGQDAFTFRLDDGTAHADYAIDLTVKRILVCAADLDCGGGDLCVQGFCQPPSALVARAGGCGCTGGDAGAAALWSVLALLHALRPRPGARARRSGGRS